ncbi:hypothetical protein KV557_00520 [Kitasatospora aureofaciens]|uniref:hypothetical protein n=1 Tax=Kitasatospora aureofaciens TaxID=1894 RepID=UPI001C4613E6|nr:hypothetical protein [Kitasatospora aureofaciens]MBV6695609.1 hypothetical protein [Kitasatospora aureofaciens]
MSELSDGAFDSAAPLVEFAWGRGFAVPVEGAQDAVRVLIDQKQGGLDSFGVADSDLSSVGRLAAASAVGQRSGEVVVPLISLRQVVDGKRSEIVLPPHARAPSVGTQPHRRLAMMQLRTAIQSTEI